MSEQNPVTDEIVLVVASQEELALVEYERYGVYLCPAPYLEDENGELYATGFGKELFWECSHVAFYGQNQIYPTVPRILARIAVVLLTHEGIEVVTPEFVGDQDVADIKERLKQLVNKIESDPQPPLEGNRQGNFHQVLFLSRPGDKETIDLPAPVVNDTVDTNGRRIAFARNFRYVTLESLKRATHTSGLVIV